MRNEFAVSRSWGRCTGCGYSNAPGELRCEKCGRKIDLREGFAASQPDRGGPNLQNSSSSTDATRKIHVVETMPQGKDASQQEKPASIPTPHRVNAAASDKLRRQLSDRVQEFRSRRGNTNLPLVFDEAAHSTTDAPHSRDNVVLFDPAPPPAPSRNSPAWFEAAPPLPAHRNVRRSAAQMDQPEFDFPSPRQPAEGTLSMPVAPFRLRLIGHGLDFALTLGAFVLFLVPFQLLARPVEFTRFLMAGIGCAYLLLVLLYGAIFIYWAGATPSMKWLGLRLVNFDGAPPERKQLFCRYLGAIASVGSFFLGFLWASVDEEKLSWHDRISKTFLALAVENPRP